MHESAADEHRVRVASFSLEQEALFVCQMLEAEGFHPTFRGGPLLGIGVVGLGADGEEREQEIRDAWNSHFRS